MTISQTPRAQDLLAQMGPNVYRAAYDKGMSLTAYLEYEDPSEGYNDGLDAFGRLLKAADIRTVSRPDIGLYASKYDKFIESTQTRALVPEWISRQWRRVQHGTRAPFFSSDGILGGASRPYSDATTPRWDTQIGPAIPLSALIGLTTSIDSNSYRAYYMTNVAADARMVRVSEGAEVPRVKLTGGDHVVNLYKYGRALEATYEMLRYQQIDKIAFFVQRMAVQAEVDKVATVIDVAINGDGNTGTSATNYNLTALDTSATSGTLTLRAWLAFKMKFVNPYMMTAALAREADALQLLLLSVGNANVQLVQLPASAGLGGFSQINPGLNNQVALGWTDDVPANKILGMDSRMAIERVVEIGANINEVERFVLNQTQILVLTETEGYAVMDANASKTLTVNA